MKSESILKDYFVFKFDHFSGLFGIETFCSGAELMVNGCHSNNAIAGILMNTQSPGL
jgi:hypothetical protein